MKSLLYRNCMVLSILVLLHGNLYAQLSRNNFTENTILREGVRNVSEIVSLPASECLKTVTYYDGLLRPVQKVTVKSTPTQKDAVQIYEYDGSGREPRRYLPFSSGSDGSYKENPKGLLTNFYSVSSSGGGKYAPTTKPFSEIRFEASSQGKILEEGAAGESWQINRDVAGNSLSANRTTRFVYTTNDANEVPVYTYVFSSQAYVSNGYYAQGELTVSEVTNEQGIKIVEYVNKEGKKILEKSVLSNSESISTYCIYDDFGNLRLVVQPEGMRELPSVIDTAFVNKWCFEYRYDEWHRKVEEKIPGAASDYYIYDRKHRVILQQDGALRKQNQWMFTKYDIFDRIALSGIYTHPTALRREDMQALVLNHSGTFETRTSVNFSTQHGYTVHLSFPSLSNSNSEILIVNYYDDYNFSNSNVPDAGYIVSGLNPEPVPSNYIFGLKTGQKTKVLGTNSYLLEVNFFDDRGRVIQSQSQNYLGGRDIETTRIDFVGMVLERKHQHTVPGSPELVIGKSFQYDHSRRLIRVKCQLNSEPKITLSQISYNELGQTVLKQLHSTDDISYLQHVDFTYNIRGWIRRVNDVALTDPTDLFGYEVIYNDSLKVPTSTARYDGTIAEVSWNDRVQNKQKIYSYFYDGAGRLTGGHYKAKNGTTWSDTDQFSETGISYDYNGNIRTLERYRPVNNVSTRIDKLTYSYNGNQLRRIEDASLSAEGFRNGSSSPEEYQFDLNGNLISDANKGIRSIKYNCINLPSEIDFSNGNKIEYIYSASSEKLLKIVTQIGSNGGLTSTKTVYIAGVEYKSTGTGGFIRQQYKNEEGRIVWNNGLSSYEYVLEDQLGNARVHFTKDELTGKARIIQKTDYYPFGMSHVSVTSNTLNKYQYNRKELQDEFGLDWYDYGARMYDPQIAKWNAIDPLAGKYADASPYNYVKGNPISRIDPDGAQIRSIHPTSYYDHFRSVRAFARGATRTGAQMFSSGYDYVRGSLQMLWTDPVNFVKVTIGDLFSSASSMVDKVLDPVGTVNSMTDAAGLQLRRFANAGPELRQEMIGSGTLIAVKTIATIGKPKPRIIGAKRPTPGVVSTVTPLSDNWHSYPEHPAALAKGIPGVRMLPDGTPTFQGSSFLYSAPGINPVVQIRMQGHRDWDFAVANELAGFGHSYPGKPHPDFTWHHGEYIADRYGHWTIMELVMSSSHRFTHRGSVYQLKKALGLIKSKYKY